MSTASRSTRCLIAGAGPAGMMLGLMLARRGIEVTVLEKWPDFFRDFRGDTIHPSTMDVLFELGLLDDFLKLPHNKTRQMRGHLIDSEVTIADFSYLSVRCPFIAFIPQWDFLNFLAEHARALPNFHLLMENEATDLIRERGRVVGVRVKNKDGEFEIRAELIVGCDGRHSTIREKAGLVVENMGAPIDVLWFRIRRDPEGAPDQSFGYIKEGKIMVMLDRDTYWQCAFIINKGDFEHIKARGLEAFREGIASLAPFVKTAVQEIQDWDEIKMLSVTVDHLTQWYAEGVICIGDAAHAMSPIGGIGINLAIQDAVAAANVLIPAFERGVPTMGDCAAIQKRRAWPTRLTQNFQVFMHRRVISPYLLHEITLQQPLPFKLLRWFPFLRWIPARFIGIGIQPEHVRYP